MPPWVCFQNKPIGVGLMALQGFAVNFTRSCQIVFQACWASFHPTVKENAPSLDIIRFKLVVVR